jgi:hypothetical protein
MDEFEKLKIKNLDIHSSYIWPPKIKITSTQFEAILLSKDEKNKYIIYQDGLVKKQNVSNEN